VRARGTRPARRAAANQNRVLGVGNQRSIAPQLDAFIRTIAEPISVACGLGVDSLAMLVEMFRLGIVPDLILFADTGGELPETYEYAERVLRPWLRLVGFPDLTIVRYRPKHGRYTTLEENCLVLGVLPSLAYGRKACSAKWKIDPQQRYEASWPLAQRAWAAGGKIEKWIGYDAGPKDMRRGHDLRDDNRYRYHYPLRVWGWDRARCIQAILENEDIVRIAAAAGLSPIPRKSACWFCPSNTTDDIRYIVDHHPDLADRIIAIEKEAKPNLRTIEGLWRRPRKGFRGTEPRPGSMTEFILSYRAEKLRTSHELEPPRSSAHHALIQLTYASTNTSSRDGPRLAA
jgi:hypothetical protein